MQTRSIIKTKLERFHLSDEHLTLIWNTQQDGKIRLLRLLDIIIANHYIDRAKNHNIISELCISHFDYYTCHGGMLPWL